MYVELDKHITVQFSVIFNYRINDSKKVLRIKDERMYKVWNQD